MTVPQIDAIAARLKAVHRIDSYLEVIDPRLKGNGEDQADHVRRRPGGCTQLLAVVSPATRASWWVFWKVGVAMEKHFPLATNAGGSTELPEYHKRRPYLRNDAELDLCAGASKAAEQTVVRQKSSTLNESVARASGTREFYRILRASLPQARR